MENEHYKEIAKIRLERASELLSEAKMLLEQEKYKSANNRAYYAIEKSLGALLINKGIETKTHTGVLKMFNMEFIRNGDGTFVQADYTMAAEAEHIRNISDYDDFYIASKSVTVEQVNNAEIIVKKVSEYLKECN